MKKTKQSSLEIFFKKPRIEEAAPSLDLQSFPSVSNLQQHEDVIDTLEVRSDANSCVSSNVYDKNDVGLYVDKINKIDDKTKYTIIKNPWMPPSTFNFPYSLHQKQNKGERRFINYKVFGEYEWLVYSDVCKGLFCKYCLVFANLGGNNPLQKLVKNPLISFAKLTGKDGDLSTHSKHQYHRDAVSAAEQFCRIFQSPNQSVINKISTDRVRIIEENRKRLLPIVKTIILMGRQNIALRGRRDDGKISEDVMAAEGNFKAILKYRAEVDSDLANHLQNCKANATYISKTTQNDLIQVCGDQIREVILERVKKAKYYSVVFDETTDVSNISQMSVVITYIYCNKRYEDFVDFLNVHDAAYGSLDVELGEPKVTGKILGKLVLNKLKEYGLNLNYCIGVGTDGCSLMTSEQVGAVNEIKKEAANAFRCPCFNHALNLSIAKSSNVSSIRNSIGTMKETTAFFNASAKRMYVLKQICGEKLQSLCETRWSERITAVADFSSNLEKIIETLDNISGWNDTQSSSKAKMLCNSLTDIDFIISIHSQMAVLYLFLPITKLFQSKTIDVVNARSKIKGLIDIIQGLRENADMEFNNIFSNVQSVCDNLNVEIKIPRIAQKQMHRSNVPSSCPKEYYKRNIFIPLLDSIIVDLNDRFSETLCQFLELNFLTPKILCYTDITSVQIKDKIENIFQVFGPILNEEKTNFTYKLYSEVLQWKTILNNAAEKPSTFEDALVFCDQDICPTIHKLLSIYMTLPVSVATSERSFSTLRLLKTFLRNRTSNERLSGLAMLNIHKEIELDTNKVIDKFACSGNRRPEFII